MLRINPVMRAASRILRPARQAFCIFRGYLDPHRHTTMSHNVHNVYLDLYEIGQYPEIIEIMSQPPRTYEPIVRKHLVEAINSTYPNANLTEELLEKNGHRPLSELVKRQTKDKEAMFSAVLPALLAVLAENIIVRESRFTWVVEQSFRLEFSQGYFEGACWKTETVNNFLEKYNRVIELATSYSQLGHSKDIEQPASPLERHFIQQLQDTNAGIPELQEDRPENASIINRWMAMLHA